MEQHTYSVLLIDDEQVTYEFVQDLLDSSREDAFTLHWVAEYDEAITEILSGNYDICLLDYNLKGFTGLDVLNAVQEHGSRMPMIMLTGQGNRAVDLGALKAGAAEYLDKSRLRAELLARTIRYAVKHRKDKNELEDLYAQVQELEQLKTDMIRIAAHDLRTPLMTMLNYTNFLMDDKDNPLQDYQTGYVEEIKAGVRRMQRIIGDILSLERIQETADDRYEAEATVNKCVWKAVEAAIPKELKRDVSVSVPDTPLIVRGDAAQLQEAATNLMTNAVKYTPEGANINIQLRSEDGFAVFTVEDTGYGIPDDMQARLFQPFYRAKSKETRRIEGTGLGLHLLRNIIRRHGGEVFFHSVYGEGSTFGFKIPLLPA